MIPAAGFGTRFLPATKAQPKEMLPVVDTPTIQYVVQEAVDSGIEDILIITGRGKRSIEDHFDRNIELERRLLEKQDEILYNELRSIEEMANIHFIRQKELNGLGDAIYHARFHCRNEPFAVLLGDTIVDSVIPCTRQMIDAYEQYGQTVIGVETVDPSKVDRYGIVGGDKLSETILQLTDMIEKPSIKDAPSNLAVAGRYILTPEIFSALEKTPRGKGNEIQLTDALRIILDQESIIATVISGKRFDIGNKLDFMKTTIEMGLKRDEFKAPLSEFIKEIAKNL
ncbi:UTP--glucose-1-phosphate uridylyltransferase GalU [Polaribacter sp. R77954]|uniref:UTP--glucose-1-phosphate uridylyltransferase GalU n=1 Tax=Polaribacter sp. R77954 TaxID=3093870 RepID=UPI0037CC8829